MSKSSMFSRRRVLASIAAIGSGCATLSFAQRDFQDKDNAKTSLPNRGGGRAAWMKKARWGVMTHYLADWILQQTGGEMTVTKWNDLIDHFDVEGLSDQLQSAGAGYHLITLGQNSGYFLSPNATYDRLVGIQPSKCSRRDLVADLYQAHQRRGIRLMVYLPSGAPQKDMAAAKALGWEKGPYRNSEFQLRWQEIVREWSERWGTKVSGWWFDGCYWPNTMYRTIAPNFSTFADAARSGNPDSVVAFNPGVFHRIHSVSPDEDYTAGEIDLPDQISIPHSRDGVFDGAQIHVLSHLGEKWGMGNPRFSDDEIKTWVRKLAAQDGVFTWDTPVAANGRVSQQFLDQWRSIGRSYKKG